MKNPANPFLISGYIAGNYFCDRVTETARIHSALRNGRNITLVSTRRMGKTALIEHAFHTFPRKQGAQFIHIDIYSTQNLNDFMTVLGKGIFKASYTRAGKFFEKALQFFTGIGGSISYDQVSGQPSFDIKFHGARKTAKTIDDLFDYLENSGKDTYIAIDEFQQITSYPEKNVEALLRTKIQHLHRVHFIFSGSHKHLLSSMFSDYKRPFYQSTEMMFLNSISREEYARFIIGHFKNRKISIKKETIEHILEWCRDHTFYVQYVCNRLYAKGLKKITPEDLAETFDEVLHETEATFYNYRNLLTSSQWNLLRAIADEEKAVMPTSAKFMKKNDLGGPSSINRALHALIEKEMLLKDEKGYFVYDVFFSRWLERLQ